MPRKQLSLPYVDQLIDAKAIRVYGAANAGVEEITHETQANDGSN